MSTYRNFAVVGYGFIASKLVVALAQKKTEGAIDSLVVLSRSDKAREELSAKGAELRIITDYTDTTSLETALRGIDVVISAVGSGALAAQPTIARAAASAGVKLFVPSDFGSNVDGHKDGVFGLKDNLKTVLREIKLPFASFYTGGFADYLFNPKTAPAFGFDFVNGKFNILGNGEAENSYTASEDIGRFVAHALTAFPKETLEWHVLRIEGERTSWNNIIAGWAARTGRKPEVTHHPIEETKARLAANPMDFASFLVTMFDAGEGGVGAREDVSNSLWPEWKPASVVDTILKVYDQ